MSYLSFPSLLIIIIIIIIWLYRGRLGALILQVYLPNNSRPESRHFNTLHVVILSLLAWIFHGALEPSTHQWGRSGDNLAQATYLP